MINLGAVGRTQFSYCSFLVKIMDYFQVNVLHRYSDNEACCFIQFINYYIFHFSVYLEFLPSIRVIVLCDNFVPLHIFYHVYNCYHLMIVLIALINFYLYSFLSVAIVNIVVKLCFFSFPVQKFTIYLCLIFSPKSPVIVSSIIVLPSIYFLQLHS